MQELLVALVDVRYSYPESDGLAVPDLSLEVRAGDRLTVRGPSASGKSTVAGLLSGALPHQWGGQLHGVVTFGNGLCRPGSRAPDIARIPALLESPTERWSGFLQSAREELTLDLLGRGLPADSVNGRIAAVAEHMDIARLLDRAPQRLSGGEQQRLAIASLLVAPSSLVVVDDALAHLDAEGVDRLRAALPALLSPEAAFVDTASDVATGAFADARCVDLPARAPARVIEYGRDALALRGIPEPWLSVRIDRAGYIEKKAVLQNVELAIAPGEVVGFVGPNGVGKSTLFAAIMGLLPVLRGEMELRGVPGFGRLTPSARAHHVAYALQSPIQQMYCRTVRDEVLVGATNVGRARQCGADAILAEIDAVFPLRHLLARHPRALSRGELRQVGLAAMLAMDRGILLLDEPTVALDQQGRVCLQRYLAAHARRGGCALIASHDRAWLDLTCDRVITLERNDHSD